ncbi:uncharacterized protein SAPINGB_P000576 [Magnusiomyces paraingens]|uniref:Uncharacterized protein n=1 Tax=Magnusiomyces paraingens TaxID=2606893 RepID=A0A5E8B095_9ASCO|nr:uncharacterized protein SAPINGB_P000576 [Saprochaete ingens]VVT44914.1 unnamed protein product [Saprochaete ingens]
MGNDGGSIPTRRELVKPGDKGPSTADLFQSKTLNHEYLWTVCALSDAPLGPDGVMCDSKGRLYSKKAVLEYLLDQKNHSDDQLNNVDNKNKNNNNNSRSTITSLKDVVELHMGKSTNPNDWICPATQKRVVAEASGTRFVAIIPCGHVFAESAVQELGLEKCLVCDGPVDKQVGLVVLNDGSEENAARVALLEARGLAHNLKPLKKEKKKKKTMKKIKKNNEQMEAVKDSGRVHKSKK